MQLAAAAARCIESEGLHCLCLHIVYCIYVFASCCICGTDSAITHGVWAPYPGWGDSLCSCSCRGWRRLAAVGCSHAWFSASVLFTELVDPYKGHNAALQLLQMAGFVQAQCVMGLIAGDALPLRPNLCFNDRRCHKQHNSLYTCLATPATLSFV